jgi:hypothetical protein
VCWQLLDRVVIHPKYRTIGLGAKIIHETLPLAGTPYVEMVAVMAKYNPFAQKAGMQKLLEQKPAPMILKIANYLSSLGFSLPLLSSEHYVLEKLKALNPDEIKCLKDLFAKSPHLRFKGEFKTHGQPFGKTADYISAVQSMDLNKTTKLVKTVGMLLQTKVYLFWSQDGKLAETNLSRTNYDAHPSPLPGRSNSGQQPTSTQP